MLVNETALNKHKNSAKLKKAFLKKLKNMFELESTISKRVGKTDVDIWDLYFSVRDNFMPLPQDPEAGGYSLFDSQKTTKIPLFVSKYYASVKVLDGKVSETQIKRYAEKGKFRSSPDSSGKLYLHDVELYKTLILASDVVKADFEEKVVLRDGREALAIFPLSQNKKGTNDELKVKKLFTWLDQPVILEMIKQRFGLQEVSESKKEE